MANIQLKPYNVDKVISEASPKLIQHGYDSELIGAYSDLIDYRSFDEEQREEAKRFLELIDLIDNDDEVEWAPVPELSQRTIDLLESKIEYVGHIYDNYFLNKRTSVYYLLHSLRRLGIEDITVGTECAGIYAEVSDLQKDDVEIVNKLIDYLRPLSDYASRGNPIGIHLQRWEKGSEFIIEIIPKPVVRMDKHVLLDLYKIPTYKDEKDEGVVSKEQAQDELIFKDLIAMVDHYIYERIVVGESVVRISVPYDEFNLSEFNISDVVNRVYEYIKGLGLDSTFEVDGVRELYMIDIDLSIEGIVRD